jgi:hypothetical protein
MRWHGEKVEKCVREESGNVVIVPGGGKTNAGMDGGQVL